MSLLTSQAAHNAYSHRPADESYPTLAAMIDAAKDEKNRSAEKTYNLRDLRAVAVSNAAPLTPGACNDTDHSGPPTIQLESPKGRANFTHWSFGQLARTIGAPAWYLRDLPPTIAVQAINHGLHDDPSTTGTSANLLIRLPNGDPTPTIRAATSESYGRLWDSDLYSAIDRYVVQAGSSDQGSGAGKWELPPTWEGGADGPRKGAYRGDRDSFLILTNGGSIVNDPSASAGNGSPGGTMFRGIMVRNSEVGAAAITIETILFRYICGNHMLWGAIADKQFRRRHVGTRVLRDTIREIGTIAYRWTNRGASADEAIIRSLIDHEIAHTKEAVIDELKAMGATKAQAEAAYLLCEQHENASPRSFWGAAQGLTRLSQAEEYTDARYLLDKIASLALQRGARKVAA